MPLLPVSLLTSQRLHRALKAAAQRSDLIQQITRDELDCMLTLITQNGASRECKLWPRAEGASLAFRLLHKLTVKCRMGTSQLMAGYVHCFATISLPCQRLTPVL